MNKDIFTDAIINEVPEETSILLESLMDAVVKDMGIGKRYIKGLKFSNGNMTAEVKVLIKYGDGRYLSVCKE